MRSNALLRLVTATVTTIVAAALFATPAADAAAPADEPLTLRVDDVVAVPGGLAAVVIRTYASRGIGQGQLCLVGGPAFDQLEEAIVFSTAGDVASTVTFDPGAGEAELSFVSPSGTVNAVDGPLAVLFFRLGAGVSPGTEEPLRIAVDSLVFEDASGAPVVLEPRSGELTVRAPSDPVELEIDGDEAAPGGLAEIAATTSESIPLSSATLVFRYDPSLTDSLPEVLLDPRHGDATLTVSHPEPGVVRAELFSSNTSLNVVPGAMVRLRLRTALSLPVGAMVEVSLDATETELQDAVGQPLDLALSPDVVEIIEATPLFLDDFEAGDFSGWCAVLP